jgi:hypothetical protein
MQTWTWKEHDKILPKTHVEWTKRNEGLYFYLYPFGDLTQGGFYACIE